MNDETQGPAEPGLTLPPTKPASPEPATRWRGAAPRRRGLAPFAAARWRRTSARRGARGLFVTHWRWLILVTLVVVGAAAMLSYSRTPTYKSAADVLVQPRLFAAATAPQAPDMGSEKAAAGSTVVLDIAARALGVTHVQPRKRRVGQRAPEHQRAAHLVHLRRAQAGPAVCRGSGYCLRLLLGG